MGRLFLVIMHGRSRASVSFVAERNDKNRALILRDGLLKDSSFIPFQISQDFNLALSA